MTVFCTDWSSTIQNLYLLIVPNIFSSLLTCEYVQDTITKQGEESQLPFTEAGQPCVHHSSPPTHRPGTVTSLNFLGTGK